MLPDSHSVIVVTWRRPTYVDGCLSAIYRGTRTPEEVVVVDASDDDATHKVVLRHPGATYVHFPGGAGHMTTARNEGLLHVSGSVISFLDDDVLVTPQWAAGMLAVFGEHRVAAVSGRVIDDDAAPSVTNSATEIGRLRPGGQLVGNFDADPGTVVDIDHGIGANMSFDRDVLAELGGFRDAFPGTALREDADIFLRVATLGHRTVFAPAAAVLNTSGPHVVGKRFDLRYALWGEHNHALLLVGNFGVGPRSAIWRYLRTFLSGLPTDERERRAVSRLVRAVVRMAAFLAGVRSGLRLRSRGGDPRRRTGNGPAITEHLRP